tara:strand:- start:345 stop:521 length:177 start_codon:yes stop_codon:yes gene_type:complete
MPSSEDKQEQKEMPVRTEINGYWSLAPKGRKKVDDMLRGLIKSRDDNKAVKEDESPVQ